jgi:hypothetical protein
MSRDGIARVSDRRRPDQLHDNDRRGDGLYVQQPESQTASALFIESLMTQVESLLARSMNEDVGSPKSLMQKAENDLQIATASVDDEEPRAIPSRSRMLERPKGRR